MLEVSWGSMLNEGNPTNNTTSIAYQINKYAVRSTQSKECKFDVGCP